MCITFIMKNTMNLKKWKKKNTFKNRWWWSSGCFEEENNIMENDIPEKINLGVVWKIDWISKDPRWEVQLEKLIKVRERGKERVHFKGLVVNGMMGKIEKYAINYPKILRLVEWEKIINGTTNIYRAPLWARFLYICRLI